MVSTEAFSSRMVSAASLEGPCILRKDSRSIMRPAVEAIDEDELVAEDESGEEVVGPVAAADIEFEAPSDEDIDAGEADGESAAGFDDVDEVAVVGVVVVGAVAFESFFLEEESCEGFFVHGAASAPEFIGEPVEQFGEGGGIAGAILEIGDESEGVFEAGAPSSSSSRFIQASQDSRRTWRPYSATRVLMCSISASFGGTGRCARRSRSLGPQAANSRARASWTTGESSSSSLSKWFSLSLSTLKPFPTPTTARYPCHPYCTQWGAPHQPRAIGRGRGQ